MSSLADLPELVGFFSYSREDDESFKGTLSALREGIQRELSAQLGRSKRTFRLWQDQEAIAPGRLWESEIKTAVEQSVFFIPIITPRTVNSEYCQFEFEAFLARERALGRTDLVFPILYIAVPALENEAQWRNHPVLSIIGRRQYVDWRQFRHLDIQTTAVREAVERFCGKIVEALHQSWLSPAERQRQEEAEAQERAEEERRRQDAEAKRRVDVEERRVKAEAPQRAEEERRGREAQTKQRAEQERTFAAAKRSDTVGALGEGPTPPKARQPSRRALVTACVLGVVLIGSVGVWLADTYRTQVPPAPSAVQPSQTTVPTGSPTAQPPPAPVQAPAPPVQPASGGVMPLSLERERTLKPKDTFKECTNCPEMIVVPAGSFTMGSPASEPDHDPRESPQHKVTFARQFAVGEFAVTFDEWDACVADGGCSSYKPSDDGWGRGRRPVINVSRDDATAYMAWLSRKTGKPYRLLTEAEWEYAARAGTTTAYYWGDDISKGNANCNGCGSQWDGKQTAPVGSFKPNAFGLYDMAGNVYQWVQDCYHDNYNAAPRDGSAWTSEDCSSFVIRGGSWFYGPRALRAAFRLRGATGNRNDILGFRVGKTLTP